MLSDILNRIAPTDDEDDQRVHLAVAGIALFLVAYIIVVSRALGKRAI